MWVNDDSEEQDECTNLFLDSGCNQKCHGEKWMERFVKHIGYTPDGLHTEAMTLNGIGGGTETLGERELYITLENDKLRTTCALLDFIDGDHQHVHLEFAKPRTTWTCRGLWGFRDLQQPAEHDLQGCPRKTKSTSWTEDATLRPGAPRHEDFA